MRTAMHCFVAPPAADPTDPARAAVPNDPAELLSLCDAPLLGLDGDGGLVIANRPGWQVLGRADTLAVRDGRPVPSDPALAARWREALQDALLGRRRMLCSTRPESRAILVRPGAGAGATIGGQGPGTGAGAALRAVRVVVRLGRDEAGRRDALRGFAESIGLTGQETRVLEALVDGETPADIALRHRVSIATVRTQIRMTVEKAGVRGARGLLAHVARMVQ